MNIFTTIFDGLATFSEKHHIASLQGVGYLLMALFVITQAIAPQKDVSATGQTGLIFGGIGLIAYIITNKKKSRVTRAVTAFLGLPIFLAIFTFWFISL